MKLIKVLKNQGGVDLLRKYWHSGAFFTAVGELLLLGKSRTALELLRLSAQLKTKRKLKRLYIHELKKFDADYLEKEHTSCNKVWFCWFQGIENAPDIVKECYKSLTKNLSHKEIIVLTSKNIAEYIELPEYILEKWKKGIITNTHMTDLIRLELLINYGGMWIDSTVLCTRKDEEIPNYFFESDLFMFQCLKPGRDGHSTYISSWLISAKSNNKVLMATKFLCYEYWKKNNKMLDYFLLHDFISIVLEYYPDEWEKIIPYDNATPHILLLRLFDEYNDMIWQGIKGQTPFHKLSYKFDDFKFELSGTFYDSIFHKDMVENQ